MEEIIKFVTSYVKFKGCNSLTEDDKPNSKSIFAMKGGEVMYFIFINNDLNGAQISGHGDMEELKSILEIALAKKIKHVHTDQVNEIHQLRF